MKINWTREYCTLSHIEGLHGGRNRGLDSHSITLRRYEKFSTVERWVYRDSGSEKLETAYGSFDDCKKEGEKWARRILKHES